MERVLSSHAEVPRVRVARESDHAVVVALITALIEELGPADVAARVIPRLGDDLRLALSSSQVRVFLAECCGEAVGLSRADVLTGDPIFRLRDDHRCGYVDQMYVVASHRARGIGRMLLEQCESWFRDMGIGHALLHAAPHAVTFYTRLGYHPNREMFKRL